MPEVETVQVNSQEVEYIPEGDISLERIGHHLRDFYLDLYTQAGSKGWIMHEGGLSVFYERSAVQMPQRPDFHFYTVAEHMRRAGGLARIITEADSNPRSVFHDLRGSFSNTDVEDFFGTDGVVLPNNIDSSDIDLDSEKGIRLALLAKIRSELQRGEIWPEEIDPLCFWAYFHDIEKYLEPYYKPARGDDGSFIGYPLEDGSGKHLKLKRNFNISRWVDIYPFAYNRNSVFQLTIGFIDMMEDKKCISLNAAIQFGDMHYLYEEVTNYVKGKNKVPSTNASSIHFVMVAIDELSKMPLPSEGQMYQKLGQERRITQLLRLYNLFD